MYYNNVVPDHKHYTANNQQRDNCASNNKPDGIDFHSTGIGATCLAS